MAESILPVLTFLAALGSGLIAGTFFAFSAFVMGALSRLPAEQGAAAMQSINVVVLNPWFLSVFMGTAAICAALAAATLFGWRNGGGAILLVGCSLYVIGTFGVTIACNVPLNEALAAVDPASDAATKIWSQYLVDWTFWNHVRSAASLGAMASFIAALAR
ncbi:MAG: DUF1772 domain-containing protein [Hyphomicrobium sp.]